MRKRLGIAVAALVLLASGFAQQKPREVYEQPAPVHLDHEGEVWAEQTLAGMTLEQKIGQMIVPWAKVEFLNAASTDMAKLTDAIARYHLGGFGVTVHTSNGMLLKSEPLEAAVMLNELQRHSPVPLIFAADFERGVAMRLNGSTAFPHAMAFGAAGDPALTEALGRITGEEARAIGVVWNWFPDADLNSNPLNPVINTRAFGEDPAQVSRLVAAYIKGAHQAGMLTTLKHFPGHGDTATDSHLALASVNGSRVRLDSLELAPFRAGIAAGTDSVMVAHVTVPALDADVDHVASNSPAVVTALLRQQMNFDGLIITDALDMNGLMRFYAGHSATPSALAAVATVKAGNDMVIIPADLDAAYNGLLRAVRSGEIPEAQINSSVRRILRAKASVGLHKAKLVDLAAMTRMVAQPASLAVAQEVADRAVTLVRDNGRVLPLKTSSAMGTKSTVPLGTNDDRSPYVRGAEARNRVLAVIFTDDLRSEYGRVLAQQLRARVPDANVVWIDANNAAFSAPPLLATVDQAETVIAAVFTTPTPGHAARVGDQWVNPIGMPEATGNVLRAILDRAAAKTALLAMGNPYIGSALPQAQVYLCTFSTEPVSEISAVKALFGEIATHGRLPVSIPQMAQRGSGLDRPRTTGDNDGNPKQPPAAN